MTMTHSPLGARAQGFDHKQVVVSAIDEAHHLAVCTDRFGMTLNVRTDLMRAKGQTPEVGEQWLVDRKFDAWTFALCLTSGKDSTGQGFKRSTVTYVSRTLAVGEHDSGVVTLAAGYRVLRVATNQPGRVRLYSTPDGQVADVDREIDTDPLPGTDIVMDCLLIPGFLAFNLSPTIDGASMEAVPTAKIPIIVSATTDPGVVTATLTFIRTE